MPSRQNAPRWLVWLVFVGFVALVRWAIEIARGVS